MRAAGVVNLKCNRPLSRHFQICTGGRAPSKKSTDCRKRREATLEPAASRVKATIPENYTWTAIRDWPRFRQTGNRSELSV